MAKRPIATATYRPSHVLLRARSGVSYLSRPNSGSVAGGFQFLGDINGPTTFNHPVITISTHTPVIVASGTEAEYAATYVNCILACDVRRALKNLGDP